MRQVCLIDAHRERTQRIQRALGQIDAPLEMAAFTDGTTALAALMARTVSPDLILLALDLPGGRSWEVLTALTADACLRTIPVVVLSATAREADRARAYELGASGDVSSATLVADLDAAVAHAQLYWQAMTSAPPAGHCSPPA